MRVAFNASTWTAIGAGILLGASIVQITHSVRDRSELQTFKQRLQCKAIADKYIKSGTSDLNSIVISRIEFSRSRGSCIVSTMEHFSTEPLDRQLTEHGLPKLDQATTHDTLKVVDLLTDETLFIRTCNGTDDCAEAMQKQEDSFRHAL